MNTGLEKSLKLHIRTASYDIITNLKMFPVVKLRCHHQLIESATQNKKNIFEKREGKGGRETKVLPTVTLSLDCFENIQPW